MPKVTILLGPPRTGKSRWATERFVAAVAQGGVDAALLLLPTARRAAEVRRELLGDERIGALFDARIMTFPQFARLLLTANHADGTEIGPMAERLILRQVVKELADAGNLPYLRSVQSFTGFIEALCQLIGEIKRAAVDPAGFEAAIERAGLDDRRSRDLAAIYAGYQMTLISRGVFDAEGLFWWARDILRRGDRRPFEDLRQVIVDGFWDFTTTQLHVLRLLVDGVDTADITLAYEDAPAAAELYEFTGHTLERLTETFPEATVERVPQARPPESPLERLGTQLFRRDVPCAAVCQAAPHGPPVQIIEAPGRRREVEEVAREIKMLVLSGHAEPGEIAVVARQLSGYADLLRTTFARYGIPLCVMAGHPALRRPVVQTALAIYNVVVNDYGREDVIKLLGSNYVTFSPDGGEAGITPDELGRVARAARILSGKDTWEQRLRIRARRLERILEQASEVEDEEREYADTDAAREELAVIEKATAYVRALFQVLDRIPRRATLQEHAAALLELIEDQAYITIAQTRGDPRDRPPHPPVLHEAALKPVFSPYKVFIFEPADRMTEEAADSLLATLEDPPAGTVFILVSSRPAAMRETVVSRCEQVRFHMVAPPRIEELLRARTIGGPTTAVGGCATLIAGLADGRPGRAIAMAQRPYLLDLRAQAIALAEELFSAPVQAALALASRTLQVAASLWELEFAAIVEQDREQDDDPADADAAAETKKLGVSHTRAMRRAVPQVLEVMAGWLRDIMVAKSGRPELMINRDYRDQAQARARTAGYDALRQAIDAITRTATYIRSYVNPDPALEAMYVELAGIFVPSRPRPAARARS